MSSTPDGTKEFGVCLFELAPSRNVTLQNVDVVPVSESVHRGIVELNVENGSSVIFDGILDSSDCNDKDQRHGVETWVDSTKDWENDQNDEKQEKDVCNVVELEPQVLWNERYRGVFGCSDLISRVCLAWGAILI